VVVVVVVARILITVDMARGVNFKIEKALPTPLKRNKAFPHTQKHTSIIKLNSSLSPPSRMSALILDT
jgi:hypothetical protein